MNSIVRVGDGDGFYGVQWNLSGDRRVSIVLRDLEDISFPLGGGGVDYDIEHCHLLSYFLPNLQLNIGKKYLFLNLNELADTWALALTWHLFDFYIFSLSIILNMIIFQPVSSSDSSSQKSMIIGYMTLLSIQFSLQYSFSILTTCFSAFVHTSFVIFPKAAYVRTF